MRALRAGAHVVLKAQGGKAPSQEDVQFGADLAAYHSRERDANKALVRTARSAQRTAHSAQRTAQRSAAQRSAAKRSPAKRSEAQRSAAQRSAAEAQRPRAISP